MFAWLQPILANLRRSMIPIDGIPARGRGPDREGRCPETLDAPPARRRVREEEEAWIPRTALYGPPL